MCIHGSGRQRTGAARSTTTPKTQTPRTKGPPPAKAIHTHTHNNPRTPQSQITTQFRNGAEPPAALGSNRDYNVDLVPKFIMACGDLVKILLHTKVTRCVTRYEGVRAWSLVGVDRVGWWWGG